MKHATTFDAEREVRRFTDAGGKGIVLRMGLFYGPESPQSWDQLRFARLGIASAVGRPGAFHPFVVIEDAARAIVAALEHAPAGIYDIVEDEPPTMAESNAAMANAVGRRHPRSLPEFLVRMTMGREIMSVMSRSQRVSNRRFKDATGWSPRYSTNWTRFALKPRSSHGLRNELPMRLKWLWTYAERFARFDLGTTPIGAFLLARCASRGLSRQFAHLRSPHSGPAWSPGHYLRLSRLGSI